MHAPACLTFEEHVHRAYRQLAEGEAYDLLTFTDFLRVSFDDERLIADEDNREWYEALRQEWAA